MLHKVVMVENMLHQVVMVEMGVCGSAGREK